MGTEIERKFLPKDDAWRAGAVGTMYRQGYLNSARKRTVRIRTVGDHAFLTIKGVTTGATRAEYEYPVPFDDWSMPRETSRASCRTSSPASVFSAPASSSSTASTCGA